MRTIVISLGTWRLFLAVMVASSHLWANMIMGPAAYAVWGFFVLSGFLMTYVLSEKYGFSRAGLKAYGFNRALRILPSYWLALVLGILSLLILVPLGVEPWKLNGSFHMPDTIGHWLFSLTLMPFFPFAGMPVPVANALGIEVGYYLLMPFFARKKWLAWSGLVIGAYLNYRIGFGPGTFPERYATFFPCMLPFAVGSLICHYRFFLEPVKLPALSLIVWCIHGVLGYKWYEWPWNRGLYVSIILSAWVTISLSEVKTTKLGEWLGDVSYPVYLFHTMVGAWFILLFGYERPLRFFLCSFSVTLILSFLVVRYLERPLRAMKKKSATRVPEIAEEGRILHAPLTKASGGEEVVT